LLRIRLSRVGKKKRPAYRVVVADSRAPRDGATVDTIGHYDPLTDPATIVINEEKAQHWLQRGAQPSEAAAKLLARMGIIGEIERKFTPVSAEAQVEAAAEAEAKAEGQAEPEGEAEPEAEVKAEAESEPETPAEATTEPEGGDES
jgi:small subunit ribosomal protein S16